MSASWTPSADGGATGRAPHRHEQPSSGTTIIRDVGSTAAAAAQALVQRDDLADVVVVTNGLDIALSLERPRRR